jgi:pimeloyl-ACP methyl ester carboxylesterase
MTDLQPHLLETEGTPSRYWLGGQPNAPLVVLTHGAMIDHREWDPLVPVLAPRYRMLVWDMPGHGLSRPGAFSFDAAINRLLAILDLLGVREAAFVGHSLGGNLGQELAFRHPERVACLVCVDCTWNFQKLTRSETFLLGLAGPIFRLYPHKALVNQSLAVAANSQAARDLVRPAMSSLSKDEIVQIMTAATGCLHYEPGYSINKPILMVLGDNDRTGNIRKAMPIWAQHEPNAKLVIVPNTSHSPNLDAPEVFHPLLVEFLAANFG